RPAVNILVTSRSATAVGLSAVVDPGGGANFSSVDVERGPSRAVTSASDNRHALARSDATATTSGGVWKHAGRLSSQRGANAHPGNVATGLGTAPGSAASLWCRGVSSVSRDRNRPWV